MEVPLMKIPKIGRTFRALFNPIKNLFFIGLNSFWKIISSLKSLSKDYLFSNKVSFFYIHFLNLNTKAFLTFQKGYIFRKFLYSGKIYTNKISLFFYPTKIQLNNKINYGSYA